MSSRFGWSASLVALGLLSAAPADAAWYEASSKHFVIYANENPKDLAAFATKLEKFDAASRHVMHMEDPPIGDGNRITIFMLFDEAAVQKLIGNKNISGYYVPTAAGPLAFVPQHLALSGMEAARDQIFLHEYSHHLMMQDLATPYPEWLVEGFAEFMSQADFPRDGSVMLGMGASGRASDLFHGAQLPLETLLSGNSSGMTKEQRSATIYARGWLLTHYLVMDSKRDGQLSRYLDELSKGKAPLDAARAAFGDLKQLDHDLRAYLEQIQRSMLAMKLKPEHARPGPVSVQPLSQGAAQVIELRARLKNGIAKDAAEALASQVRQVQQRFPGDELVERTLAEAELDAGHAAAAASAADRALAANPKSTEALILKGRAMEVQAADTQGEQRSAAFDKAREVLIQANKLDSEDPEPLMEFYKSFLQEGVRPTQNAIDALHYASDLAPQDFGLRMNSAFAYVNEGKLAEARATLVPVAYSPHAGSVAQSARRMIQSIDSGAPKSAIFAAASKAGVQAN